MHSPGTQRSIPYQAKNDSPNCTFTPPTMQGSGSLPTDAQPNAWLMKMATFHPPSVRSTGSNESASFMVFRISLSSNRILTRSSYPCIHLPHPIRRMGCSAQGGKEGEPRGSGDTYCAEYAVRLISCRNRANKKTLSAIPQYVHSYQFHCKNHLLAQHPTPACPKTTPLMAV